MEGIYDFVVYGYLVMEVGAGGIAAGAADEAQDVASFYLLAVSHEHFGEMAVGGLDAIAMTDPNEVSHLRIIGGRDDFAFGWGPHGFPAGGTDIHA